MKPLILPSILFLSLLLVSYVGGCHIGNDLLWVEISETDWETSGVDGVYHDDVNQTRFSFKGKGIFNNPHGDDYRIVHNDGCGFKPEVKYTPNKTITKPLEATDFYPRACVEKLHPVDYPSGKTEFEILGGIQFQGNLTDLPAGLYEISISLLSSVEDEVTSIEYLLQVDGELHVMLLRDYCGLQPSNNETRSSIVTVLPVQGAIIPSLLGLFAFLRRTKNTITI